MRIVNEKAHFDYTIMDRFEAGISLFGSEVKSLRAGHAKLAGSFVRLINNEAFLINAHIFPYAPASPPSGGYDPMRTRRLLLHRHELICLQSKLDGANLTLIPLVLYTKGPRIKLEVGLAKGKKQYEKREVIRKRDQQRELDKQFRGKVK